MKTSQSIPIGTIDELKVLGLSIPGVNFTTGDSSTVVSIPFDMAEKVVCSILKEWGVSEIEQKDILLKNNRENIVDILAIHKAITVLFSNQKVEWISNPNSDPIFEGRSPIEHIQKHDLKSLKIYLNAKMWS